MKEIEIRETVLFYDTDCGGVVSNIAYLRYVEKARAALFTSLGMDLLSMTATGLFPVVGPNRRSTIACPHDWVEEVYRD